MQEEEEEEEEDEFDAAWAGYVESVAEYPRQRAVVDRILAGESLAILGGPGTGKSHVIKAAVGLLMLQAARIGRQKNKKPRGIQVVAPTGVAAVNVGGMTVNRYVGLTPKFNTAPKGTKWKDRSKYGGLLGDGGMGEWIVKLGKVPLLRLELTRLQTMIVDEISMVAADFLDMLNVMFQEARHAKGVAYGGVQMVVVGDFHQLAPIATFGPDDARFEPGTPQYAFFSRAWYDAFGDGRTVLLTRNIRQGSDAHFAKLLYKIGNGENLRRADVETLLERTLHVPPGSDVLRLYGQNVNVNAYNQSCMGALVSADHRLSGILRVCDGAGGVVVCEPGGRMEDGLVMEDIETIERMFDIDRLIFLKEGCRVMLTTNVDVYRKQCNGSVGYFRGVDGDVLLFDMDGCESGIVRLERKAYRWNILGGGKRWKEYLQYPVCLAYAMTVHKAQGVTVDRLHLGSDFTMYSQFFVAASRVRTLAGLTLDGFKVDWIKVDPYVIEYYRKNHHVIASEEMDEDVLGGANTSDED